MRKKQNSAPLGIHDELLSHVLPDFFVERWRQWERDLIMRKEDVLVIYADLSGFTVLSREITAQSAIQILNDLVDDIDDLAMRLGICKVTTVGASYLAVLGISSDQLNKSSIAVDFILKAQEIVKHYCIVHDLNLGLATAIHSGDVFAGVVGRNLLKYDVWGEAVNMAKYLCDYADQDEILVGEKIMQEVQSQYQVIEKQGIKDLEGIKVWKVGSEFS